MGGFEGRHVIVTGGTGALGAAIVARLIDAGASCLIPCRSTAEAERFSGAGPLARHPRVSLDLGPRQSGIELTDEQSVDRLYAGLPNLWASIHAAGGFAMLPFDQTPKSALIDQFNINFLTAALCTRQAINAIRRAEPLHTPSGGRIVNVAARPALEPRLGSGMAAYTAAKAALAALTQAVAEEVAPEGIFVNAVVPSIMDTPANRAAMPTADHSKWASLDDVAATIVFLASPDNSATRGGLVPVYGRA